MVEIKLSSANQCVIRGNIFWSGEKNSTEQASIRRQIEAMDEESQSFWRKEMAWVFEPSPADIEYASWSA